MPYTFFDAAMAVASPLDDLAPQGFFRAIDYRGGPTDYLVSRAGSNPVALVLTGGNQGHVWDLNPGTAHRAGVSFGPVELQIAGDIVLARPQIMEVILSSEGAFVVVDRSNEFYYLRISDVATRGNPHDGFVVRRWRLIQRDHAGSPIVLFERDPDAEVS